MENRQSLSSSIHLQSFAAVNSNVTSFVSGQCQQH